MKLNENTRKISFFDTYSNRKNKYKCVHDHIYHNILCRRDYLPMHILIPMKYRIVPCRHFSFDYYQDICRT